MRSKDTYKSMSGRRRFGTGWLAGPLLWLLALSACSGEPQDDTATASISPYNHTEDYIHQFYVDGAYGGNSRAYGGGRKVHLLHRVSPAVARRVEREGALDHIERYSGDCQ